MLTHIKQLALVAGVALVAATATAGTASAGAQSPAGGVRLACVRTVADQHIAAACTWEVNGVRGAAGYKLWRGTGAASDPTRTLVFRTSNLDITRHLDSTVEPGHRYAYALVVVDANGNPLATSNLSVVSFPRVRPDIERLKLACLKHDGMVRCEWRKPLNEKASKVTLFRVVDRGPREALVTLQPPAGGVHEDAIPAGARVIRYSLVSFDAGGNVVGRSPVIVIVVQRTPVAAIN